MFLKFEKSRLEIVREKEISKKEIQKIIGENLEILFLLFFVAVFSGCNFSEKWIGFYYPDGCLSCVEKYIISPKFDNKNDCLKWAKDLKIKNKNPKDDFECGKNCKEKGYKFYVCEETIDF